MSIKTRKLTKKEISIIKEKADAVQAFRAALSYLSLEVGRTHRDLWKALGEMFPDMPSRGVKLNHDTLTLEWEEE